MENYSTGQVSSTECRELLRFLQKELEDEFQFFAGLILGDISS
jgi:hypothetical protein